MPQYGARPQCLSSACATAVTVDKSQTRLFFYTNRLPCCDRGSLVIGAGCVGRRACDVPRREDGFAVTGDVFASGLVGDRFDDFQSAPGLRQAAGSLADGDRFGSSVVHVDAYLANAAPQKQTDRRKSVPHGVGDELADGQRRILNDCKKAPPGEHQTDVAASLPGSGRIIGQLKLGCVAAIGHAGRVFLLNHTYGLPADVGGNLLPVTQGYWRLIAQGLPGNAREAAVS